MTQPLTPLGYASPLYYSPSGRFSIPGVLLAMLVSCAAAIVCGAIYSYIDLYNPCISVVTGLLVFGFGAGVGLITGTSLRFAHVRNMAVTVLAATFVALVALDASWVVWVYAVLQRFAGDSASHPPGIPKLVMNPRLLGEVIIRINQVGTWTMGHSYSPDSGRGVNGIELLLMWIGEAAIIVGAAIYFAIAMATSSPYCENCGRWCATRSDFLTTAPNDPVELKRRLEAKEFGWLGALVLAEPGNWWAFDLHHCEGCGSTRTLTVRNVIETINKKGEKTTKSKKIIDKLLLTNDEAAVAVGTRPAASRQK